MISAHLPWKRHGAILQKRVHLFWYRGVFLWYRGGLRLVLIFVVLSFWCSASRLSSFWDQPMRFWGLYILHSGGQTRSWHQKEDRKISITKKKTSRCQLKESPLKNMQTKIGAHFATKFVRRNQSSVNLHAAAVIQAIALKDDLEWNQNQKLEPLIYTYMPASCFLYHFGGGGF